MPAFRVPDILEERPAQQQDEIRALERFADLRGIARQRGAIVRMPGRKRGVVAQPFEPDRCADRFDQRHQRAGGACTRHVIAGDDRGTFRLQQCLGEFCDTRGIGRRGAPQPVGGGGLDRSFLLQHVDRQRDEHRAFRRIGRDLEGAAQDRRDLVGAFDLHAPFGDGRRHRDEVVAEQRTRKPHPRILLARGRHHRRIRLERAVERADAVAEPRRDMEIGDHGAAARLRIETRGGHRDALVQRHHIVELREGGQAVEQRRLGGAGIAEDMAHAVRDKGLHQHPATAHFVSFPFEANFPGTLARERHKPASAKVARRRRLPKRFTDRGHRVRRAPQPTKKPRREAGVFRS